MNKIHYMRMLLAGILFFSYLGAGAQVSINKLSEPAQGALLQLHENASTGGAANASAGLLLPRVKLTSLTPSTDAALAASIGATGSYSRSNHTGLWVYNTHTDDALGICPGVYVWNGTSWKRQHEPCITADPCEGMAITVTAGELTQSVCAGDAITTVNLTAGSAITYTGTLRGLIVTGSGTTNVTISGIPTATTSLTFKTGDGSCTNATRIFSVTRNALPTAMTISGNAVCLGDKATLAVTSSTTGLTIKWYDTAAATEALATGTSYTTAALTAGRSYWVEAENSAGCKLRQKVDVTVNAVPPTMTISGNTICSGDKATLAVTPASGYTYRWYDTATSTEALHTGASYTTTEVLTAGRSYWVEATNATGCKRLQEVEITVTPIPDAPTLSKTTVNLSSSTATTNLNSLVTSGTTNLVWYNSSNIQITGTAITSAKAGTYYAKYKSGDCYSEEITVFVMPPVSSLAWGSGKFVGPACFDIAYSNDDALTCGLLESRRHQKTDFSLRTPQDAYEGRTATYTGVQVYSFIPQYGGVSYVSFEVEDPSGVIQSVSQTEDYSNMTDITDPCKVTLAFKTSLNETLKGRKRANALKASVYVRFNNKADGSGDFVMLKLNLRFQDCDCCGVNNLKGEWVTFMCHNLGADQTLDPLAWKSDGDRVDHDIKGYLYQWGRQSDGHQLRSSPTTTTLYDNLIPNDDKFVLNEKSWVSSGSTANAWGVYPENDKDKGIKRNNDPCPEGWIMVGHYTWRNIMDATYAYNMPSFLWVQLNNIRWVTNGLMIGEHLFLPRGGERRGNNGSIGTNSTTMIYATRNTNNSQMNGSQSPSNIRFTGNLGTTGSADWNGGSESLGVPVRCILYE